MPAKMLEDAALQQCPMPLPVERGLASAAVLAVLRNPDAAVDLRDAVASALHASIDLLRDEDLQLALFCLYELHYGGIAEVSEDLEWSPDLNSARLQIERPFEEALRAAVVLPDRPDPTMPDVAAALFVMTGEESGPSLARYLALTATLTR